MAGIQEGIEICSICLHEFQQPKILYCKHAFCFICLESYVTKTSKNDQFPCPLCRQYMKVPSDGVKDFLDKPNMDSSKSEVPSCDMCEDISSRFRCVDCEQYLCKSCKIMHDKLKICKDHVVVRLDNISDQTLKFRRDNLVESRADNSVPKGDNSEKQREKSMVQDTCPYHQDKSVDIFCKRCFLAICSKCFISDHNGHNYSDLHDDKTRQDSVRELNSLNTEIQKHIKKLEEFSESLNKKFSDVTDSVKESCDQIDQQVDRICSEVTRLGDTMKAELQQACDEEVGGSNYNTGLTKLMEEIRILTANLKASVKHSKNVLEDNAKVQLLDRLHGARREQRKCSSRKLEMPDVRKIYFQGLDINTDLLGQQLGIMLMESKDILSTVQHDTKFDIPNIDYQEPRRQCVNITCHFASEVMSIGETVYGERFTFAGKTWRVCLRRSNKKYVFIGLDNRRQGGYDVWFRLVNYRDGSQSEIVSCDPIQLVKLIDYTELRDRQHGFLHSNIFTIQVQWVKTT